MPTPSEQKALAFVAIVILLGGAARVLRAGATAPPTPAEQQGLSAQAAAVDSAARGTRQPKGRSKRRPARLLSDTMPHVVGGVASVPPTFARPDRPFDHTPYGAERVSRAAPLPSPRIDTDARGLQASPPVRSAPGTGKKAPPGVGKRRRALARHRPDPRPPHHRQPRLARTVWLPGGAQASEGDGPGESCPVGTPHFLWRKGAAGPRFTLRYRPLRRAALFVHLSWVT